MSALRTVTPRVFAVLLVAAAGVPTSAAAAGSRRIPMSVEPESVHAPVMPEEVLSWLAPRDGGVVVDGTVGAGGHASRVLAATATGVLIGVDRDEEILELARQRLAPFGERARLLHARYDQVEEVRQATGMAVVSGVLLDLGVSSLQLDRAERGFAFDQDGPLDMRMDATAATTAAELVNRGSREALMHAVGVLGDEPRARRVVDAILEERRRAPILRTCELAELVRKVTGGGRHHHPATRTFQGLRMAVNDELGALERALPALAAWLGAGGRMVVLAFHGGEDRVVKVALRELQDQGLGQVLTRRPIPPSAEEVARNPRSRSARLRAFERTSE